LTDHLRRPENPDRFEIRLIEQISCRKSASLRSRNPNAPRTSTIPNFGIWVEMARATQCGSNPNKSQTTFITCIKNVMLSKEGLQSPAMANFWLFTTGFLPLRCGGQVSLFGDKSFLDRRLSWEPTVQILRLGKSFRRERARRQGAGESRRRAL
jgi:hypothetical protein